MQNIRTLTTIKISADKQVILRFKGRTNAVLARALDIQYNQHGDIHKLLLSRVIHDEGEDEIEFSPRIGRSLVYHISGAFVSELTLASF